ncbi:MAG: hypothetical protein WDN03_00600 [Rhizomicrobium sp.]
MAAPISVKLSIIAGRAADAVGVMAQDDAADRAQQEAGAEGEQRQHQAAEFGVQQTALPHREEGMADGDGEGRVGGGNRRIRARCRSPPRRRGGA